MKNRQKISGTKLYTTWANMKTRCGGYNDYFKKHYKDRGIKVCKKWLGKNGYKNFIKDMQPTFKDGLTLDRINNNKGYSPKNCRWITQKEQNRNTRRNLVYKGEYTTEASLRLGSSTTLICQRLKRGWTLEEAFTIPSQQKKKYE